MLVGEADAQGQRDDQAERAQRLDHDQAAAIQRRRLHDPADGLERAAGQPDGLAQDLGQEARVALGRRGLQGTALLEHGSEREAGRGDEGESSGHGGVQSIQNQARTWAPWPMPSSVILGIGMGMWTPLCGDGTMLEHTPALSVWHVLGATIHEPRHRR